MRHYLMPFIFLSVCVVALSLAYFSGNLIKKISNTDSVSPTTPIITPSIYPTGPVEMTFSTPTTWKTTNLTTLDISLCLPPDWSYQKPNKVISYLQGKVIPITTIKSFPSTPSGILKDIYLTQKLAAATASAFIPPAASVDQFKLNNLPAMFISLPGHPDVIVVPTGDNLYEFSADSTSPDVATQEFQNNFYTMISCIKPL